jgi:hypothetical protein
MPAVMTLGGIALAVLGLLIAFLGLPDRMAGVSLGSDLVQAGATIFAGGLVLAAMGQVLKALRDVADRIDEAGFGISSRRPALNDGLSETAPMPLPRAGRNAPPVEPSDASDAPVAPQPREPRAPRGPQPAQRAARPEAPAPQRQLRPAQQSAQDFDTQPQDQDFADEYPEQRQAGRATPRWMREQADANDRQQQPGVIPLQSNRQSRANPAAPPSQPPRREQAQAPEPELRRRAVAAPEPEEFAESEPTVVRSGIIAGMAYTLYSDRSIEAELPAGTVRFGSIEELQEHVKRAGVDDPQEYRGPNTAQH